jgi:hypothetical protein
VGSRQGKTARRNPPSQKSPPKSLELESWSVRVRLRLTRKLASLLDGIDVSSYAVGDVIELPRYEAELLIAERWAEAVTERSTLVPPNHEGRSRGKFVARVAAGAEATDMPTDTLHKRLWEICRQMELKSLGPQERRRTEDLIREELHDSRARTFHNRKLR